MQLYSQDQLLRPLGAVRQRRMTSRAVHKEMRDDITTDKRPKDYDYVQMSIRVVWCDRGSNFVGAKNELKKMLKVMDETTLEKKLGEFNCEFVFNAPHSSHMGGV